MKFDCLPTIDFCGSNRLCDGVDKGTSLKEPRILILDMHAQTPLVCLVLAVDQIELFHWYQLVSLNRATLQCSHKSKFFQSFCQKTLLHCYKGLGDPIIDTPIRRR